jgi:hypothetical protein
VGKQEITVEYLPQVGRWFFLRCRGFDVFGGAEQQQIVAGRKIASEGTRRFGGACIERQDSKVGRQ